MMWWWHRFRARRQIGSRVRLWYHRDYAAPEIPPERRVANLQPDRAEHALARLEHLGLTRPQDVAQPGLASFADLERVHTRRYIESVGHADTLGRIFGLEKELVDVDPLLTAQRRAVGGTIAAALAAARRETQVAFNLGGGFHHAGPDAGAGFCVFNDVAVAIARLRAEGYHEPIAIVDLDFHQGDGNLAAFQHDPTVLVYSVHGALWTERVSASCRNYLLPSGTTDNAYLNCLAQNLRPALTVHNTKLLFYVAGVDVLGGDLLGDFALTAKGVLARDRLVQEVADDLGAPLVVTLAGGYSSSAWQCTSNYVRWLLTGVTRVDRDPYAKLRYRYARVARQLDPWELQRDEADMRFSDEDLLPDLGPRRRRLLLDYYSRHGVEFALERYGLMPKLRTSGFTNLHLTINTDDTMAQGIRVEGRPAVSDGHDLVLVEIVVSRRLIDAPERVAKAGTKLAVLRIEWLLLQNPTRSFTPARPRLPGQEYPGLGLAHDVHELLVRVGQRLHLEAIVHSPAHYHNAVVASREYMFVDPVLEGRFRAARRVLANISLAVATGYVDQGRLRLKDGTPYAWEPSETMLPVSDRMRGYFVSRHYQETMREARDDFLAAGLHLDLADYGTTSEAQPKYG